MPDVQTGPQKREVFLPNYPVIVYGLLIMKQWCSEQRAFVIKPYYKNNDSTTTSFAIVPRELIPSAHVIKGWFCKFGKAGSGIRN